MADGRPISRFGAISFKSTVPPKYFPCIPGPPIINSLSMSSSNTNFAFFRGEEEDEGEWETVTRKAKSSRIKIPADRSFDASSRPDQSIKAFKTIPPNHQQIETHVEPEAEIKEFYREHTLATLRSHCNYVVDSRLMILLCGIPGSGKSTFARKLISSLPTEHQNSWLHLNQDALKSRNMVIDRTLLGLQEQKNIIIDRCNFDFAQRIHWIELAQQCPIYLILCVVVPNFSDVGLCSQRAFLRGNSDGVHDEETNWQMVCKRMKQEFLYPSENEGIHCIYPCESWDDADPLIFTICGNTNEP